MTEWGEPKGNNTGRWDQIGKTRKYTSPTVGGWGCGGTGKDAGVKETRKKGGGRNPNRSVGRRSTDGRGEVQKRDTDGPNWTGTREELWTKQGETVT